MFKLVVLSCVLAVALASAIAPLGLVGAGRGGWAGAGQGGWGNQGLASQLGAPLVAPGVAAASALGAYNYRGPLSLAPGQPANILAADGRPLDTLSVNLDRAAHYTARAVDGAHALHKRSAVLAAAPVYYRNAGFNVPLVAPLAATPVAAAPLVGAWGPGAAWAAH